MREHAGEHGSRMADHQVVSSAMAKTSPMTMQTSDASSVGQATRTAPRGRPEGPARVSITGATARIVTSVLTVTATASTPQVAGPNVVERREQLQDDAAVAAAAAARGDVEGELVQPSVTGASP
jgi:hypothetical protein